MAKKILSKRSLAESFRPSWLGLVPVLCGCVAAALLLPRQAPLRDVPLPQVNTRAIARVEAEDDRTFASVDQGKLPDEVRALGTDLRRFNAFDVEMDHARTAPPTEKVRPLDDIVSDVHGLRAQMDRTVAELLGNGANIEQLLGLRSFQLAHFLRELARFEASGVESDELHQLGGAFIARLRPIGWCEGNRILMDESTRRVAYKSAWNAIVGVEQHPKFRLSLDEQRVLTRFRLLHPTPDRQTRGSIDSLRKAGKGKEADALYARAIDADRFERVDQLEKVDPDYPAQLAKMVLHGRLHRIDKAKVAFQAWVSTHSEGDYALRARNQSLTLIAEESL